MRAFAGDGRAMQVDNGAFGADGGGGDSKVLYTAHTFLLTVNLLLRTPATRASCWPIFLASLRFTQKRRQELVATFLLLFM
jgi:hypothetical protein